LSSENEKKPQRKGLFNLVAVRAVFVLGIPEFFVELQQSCLRKGLELTPARGSSKVRLQR
jgi:hypothetical protein